MTKQVQRRRGTATQHTSFTGADGEISVNTTNKSIHVHDAITTGGFEAARIDLNNVTGATVAGKVTGSTLSSLTITSADINGGTIDSTAIGNTTPSSGIFTTLSASSTLTLGGTAVTSTAAELNILDGVTATTAELNILDGVTSTTAELNILDGVTSTAAELNILDGVTATAAELNFVDGVTSNVQTQLNTKAPLASPAFTGGIDVTGNVELGANNSLILNAASTAHTNRINWDYDGTTYAHIGRENATGDMQFTVQSAERMRISSSGNVGIGTSSPSSKLHVVSSSGENKIISEATAASQQASLSLIVQAATPGQTVIYMGKTGATTNGQLGYDPNTDAMTMFTNNAERMRISSTGNVGIGTSSPQKLLHLKDGDIVVGNGTASNNAVIGRIGFSTDSSNSRFIGIESFRGSDAANADLRFHTFGGDSNSGERMRIDTSGNVGIGTTSPGDKLSVVGTTNREYVRVESTFSSSGSEAGIRLKTAGTNGKEYLIFNANTEGSLRIYDATAASERMRIDSSGNVGIGTGSPAGKLHVSGGRSFFAAVSEPYAVGARYSEAGGSFYFGAASASATPDAVFCQAGGSERMRITDGGNVGIGTSSPNFKLSFGPNIGNTFAVYESNGSNLYGIGMGGDGSGGNPYRTKLFSNGSEAVSITSAGSVGIGTGAPVAKLAVVGGTSNASNLATAYSLAAFNITPKSTSGYSLQFGSGPSDFPYIQMSAGGAASGNLLIQPYGGSVGIGTSSPLRKLHVASVGEGNGVSVSGSAPNISITNADTDPNSNTMTSVFALATSAGNYGLNAGEAAWFGIGASRGNFIVNPNYSGAGVKNIILQPTSGSVLVGTASNIAAGAKIFAQGTGVGIAVGYGTGSAEYRHMYMNSGDGALYFFNPTNYAYLTAGGAWTNASDARLKKDIVDIKYGLAEVLLAQPRSYKMNDVEGDFVGFIAQELQPVIPEVVSGDPEKQLGVDYGSLVAVAFKAIQEQQAIIMALETRLSALEG